jgi:hypothetical protein
MTLLMFSIKYQEMAGYVSFDDFIIKLIASSFSGKTTYCEISSCPSSEMFILSVISSRVDAAKHMWPEDLQYIYSHVKNLSTVHGFPPQTRPFIYQEVMYHGDKNI